MHKQNKQSKGPISTIPTFTLKSLSTFCQHLCIFNTGLIFLHCGIAIGTGILLNKLWLHNRIGFSPLSLIPQGPIC